MKVVLMGTPSFVVPIFDAIANRHEVIAVFTRAPKPMGRKHIITNSPVHDWAISRGLPVFHNPNTEYNFSPDMVVVVAYGAYLRENVLNSAPCINLHPSLLPKYRGAAPIKTAIMNGDTESGVCLMKIAPEWDSGDILMCKKFDILIDDTNDTVEQRVAKIGTDMILEYMAAPENFPPQPQIGEPVYTAKIKADTEIIDWNKPAIEIHNLIRAIGGARTKINGVDAKILKTKMNGDKLEILEIQPAGKRPMDWKSFVNGLHTKEIVFGK
jgi:methionyl-tRNA formyltransferase